MGYLQFFLGIIPEKRILFKFYRSIKVNLRLGGCKSTLLGVFLSQTCMSHVTICDFKGVKYSTIHGILIGFYLIRIDRVYFFQF